MKKNLLIGSIIISMILLSYFMVDFVSAQQPGYTLSWSVFGSGGLGGSAEKYTINSTFGQPVTGIASGGNITVVSGFWSKLVEIYNVFLGYLPLIFR